MAAPALALSGNEITDAARQAALAWATNQQGGQTDGATVPAGVGIYRNATNLFRRGQCDATTDWTSLAAGTTVAIDATVHAPFSPQSIKVTCDGSGAGQGVSPVTATGRAAATGIFGTGSVYFRGVAGQSYIVRQGWLNTDASLTLGTGTAFTAGTGAWPTITIAGTTWEILTSQPVSVAAGKTGDQLVIRVAINGTRAESFWVAHAMLESLSSSLQDVVPYIATSGGGTSLRATSGVVAPPSMLGTTQGWMAVRFRAGNAAQQVPSTLCSLDDGTTNNRISLTMSGASWQSRRVVGGVGGSVASIGDTHKVGDLITGIVKWDATTIAISINGSSFTSVANAGGAFVPTEVKIGGGGGASNIDGSVLWFACGTGTLSNADAANLHAISVARQRPTGLAELPGNATGYWKAVDSTYEARSPSSSMLLCGPLFICGTQTVMPQFQQDAICGTPTCGFATCGMFWAATYAGGEHLLAQVPDAVTISQVVPAAGLTLGAVAPVIDETDILSAPAAGLQLVGVVPAVRLSQTVAIPQAGLVLGGVAPGFVGQLWLHDEVCTDLTLVAAGSQDLVLVAAGVTTLDLDPEECR